MCIRDRPEVLQQQAAEVRRRDEFDQAAPGGGGRLRRLIEEATRHLGKRPAIEFHGGVERDHRLLANAALQRGECRQGVRGQGSAHQQHGVVAREEAAVVLQHAQAQATDLRIGAVHVDQVYLARRQGLVGQAMVQRRCVRDRQAIAALERAPAVGAYQEFVRETRPQPRCLGGRQARQCRCLLYTSRCV